MRRTDHILLYTSPLLSLPDSIYAEIIKELAVQYELNEPAKSGIVFIGGRMKDGSQSGLTEWVQALRAENIKEITFFPPSEGYGQLAIILHMPLQEVRIY